MATRFSDHLRQLTRHPKLLAWLLVPFILMYCSQAAGNDTAAAPVVTTIAKEAIDVIWLTTAAALVFLMQMGFAFLESGSSRAKNCVNVMIKNFMDVCLGSIIFWAIGFGLMFGANPTGWFGQSGYFMHAAGSWDYSFLLFQMMFAATAATIASGAMAERARFHAYLVLAVIIIAFVYPLFGSWAWGSYYEGTGWLAELGFIDFAGSSVVHSVGGWAALAAIIILGPRTGRFSRDGKVHEIAGHNLNFVVLGGFILWFGWFGFNGGSTTGADVSIGLINLNTQLAAAAGGAGALLFATITGKPLLVVNIVNGVLAGLVAITAGCASMEPLFAVFTGLSAAFVYSYFAQFLIWLKIDDVVGAVAVHGAAGAWGTLCAGLFLRDNLFDIDVISVQLLGIVSCFAWAFGATFAIAWVINKSIGLRADILHEQRGLDFTEHAEVAYPEFHQQTYYSKQNLETIDRE
ncbi:MAG TPA: ammonium transporter [Marinagarivorans sp.]